MIGPLEQRCRAAAERCAWTLLGSVGMSTASGARVCHSVSPEDALLVASIGSESDRRLRDEARDWFLEFDDLVSRPALKHRVARLDDLSRAAWVSFVAPLSGRARGVIPGAPAADTKGSFVRSGKSRRVVTIDVAYGLLRCRAAFGTQARADVLFLLATTPDSVRGWMADALARSAGYTKSAVRDALDRLTEAGIVRRTRVGNADWFALSDPEQLIALIGPVATPPVDTIDIPRVLRCLLDASRLLDEDDADAVFVPARAALEPVDAALENLRAPLGLPTHDFKFGRRELEAMIGALGDRLGVPSRQMWPW